jgi:predicted aspartyl protease
MKLPFFILTSALMGCASAPPKSSQAVPFHYIAQGFIVVPVQINDGPTYDFLLDTGAGTLIVDKSIAKQAPSQPNFVGRRMSGQALSLPMVRLSKVTMAGHSVRDISSAVFDLNQMLPGFNIKGVISLAFFKEIPFTIDYGKFRVEFESPDSLNLIRAAGHSVTIKAEVDGPSLDVHMPLILPSGKMIVTEVDTGTPGAMILNQNLMDELKVSPVDKGVKWQTGTDETGHQYTRYYVNIKGSPHIPGTESINLENPRVQFQEIIYDGLVGQMFLNKYRVTFDLPGSAMIFRTKE